VPILIKSVFCDEYEEFQQCSCNPDYQFPTEATFKLHKFANTPIHTQSMAKNWYQRLSLDRL